MDIVERGVFHRLFFLKGGNLSSLRKKRPLSVKIVNTIRPST